MVTYGVRSAAGRMMVPPPDGTDPFPVVRLFVEEIGARRWCVFRDSIQGCGGNRVGGR